MSNYYHCQQPQRREKVRTTLVEGVPVLNGIDYLEMDPEDSNILQLRFVHPLPAPPATQLTAAHFSISGGVRVADLVVEKVQINGRRARLQVSASGDFSTYRLALHAVGDPERLPLGFTPPFDGRLAALDFSFKAACPSDLDCQSEAVCPLTSAPTPVIDYLAKDYDSFRRLMLDRLHLLMPDWREESPADLLIALTELFAHVGDQLSYFQDAAAGEATLHTARLRPSVRRHARLLDYPMHDGCNARAWVCFSVDAAVVPLPPRTPLMAADDQESGGDAAVLSPEAFDTLAETGKGLVFETLNPKEIVLRSAHNELRFHTWSDEACCLPIGSTSASLEREAGQELSVGQILLFEEVRDPLSGKAGQADPAHRHAVCLTAVRQEHDRLENQDLWQIEWHSEDALPFALCLHQVDDGDGELGSVSVARANVTLADHGRSLAAPAAAIEPAEVIEPGYRPQVRHPALTFAAPLAWGTESSPGSTEPLPSAATAVIRQDPHQARPDRFTLTTADTTWRPTDTLLPLGPLDPFFVVETENDGSARLRFGDPARGIMGRAPTPGERMVAHYRVGSGTGGNLGAEALNRVRTTTADIIGVRNPLPAAGGTDPESLEQVKFYAPHRFRRQERAVTEADYATVAERFPGVQKAVARFRWTGSWTTVFVTVDFSAGRKVDQTIADEVRSFMEPFRMAGYDLEVVPPEHAPLDIVLKICLADGYVAGQVKAELLAILGTGLATDGTTGRFHPDRHTFGQAVYLSEITAAALSIEGVSGADVARLQRFGGMADSELEKGYFRPGELEIIQMHNDPNFPERGQLALEFTGGL